MSDELVPSGTTMARQRGGTLTERADSLNAALEAGRGRIETTLIERSATTISRARERLSLSGEHTIVGFFGATGSGKSSLFNAVAGQKLARAAHTRPTTVAAQAAVWGREGSEEVLDWLGVSERVYPLEDPAEAPITPEMLVPETPSAALNETRVPAPGLWNRIRTIVGKGQTHTRSGGLILLDLPDFDSVRRDNRELVERMVGYVDVLVWVVDPQKYADAVLHHEFIEPLAAHGGTMLCVLNQSDLLDAHDLPQVLDSLRQLLIQDGISHHLLAEPIAVSARTGAGLDSLKSLLGQVAAAKSAALQRVTADLDAIHGELSDRDGGPVEASISEESVDTLTASCFRASGAGTVLDAAVSSYKRRAGARTGWIATRWVAKFRPDPLKRLHLGYADGSDTRQDTAVDELFDAEPGQPSADPAHLVASSLPPLSPAQRASVANSVRAFGAETAHGIEEPWNSSIRNAALEHEQQLPAAFERAIAGVDYRTDRRQWWWALLNSVQWVALLSALVGVLWLTGMAAAAYFQVPLPPPPTPDGSPVPVPTLLLLLGVLLGIVAAGAGRALTAMDARIYRQRIQRALTRGLEAALNEQVVHPVENEIMRLETYRNHLR